MAPRVLEAFCIPHHRFATLLVVLPVTLLMLVSCVTIGQDELEFARSARMDDLEARVAKKLQKQYGDGVLRCGNGSPAKSGVYAGEVQAGNGIKCRYIVGEEGLSTDKSAVDVTILVFHGGYNFESHRAAQPGDKAWRTPEWMYRDGLSCEQLTQPPGAETAALPEYIGGGEASTPGLTYWDIMYYWHDNGEPEEMVHDDDGEPNSWLKNSPTVCPHQFTPDQIDRVLARHWGIKMRRTSDEVTPNPLVDPTVELVVSGLTAFQIRKALELDHPNEADVEVDCSVVGPLLVGSLLTCAPITTGVAEPVAVAVVDRDGGFLVGEQNKAVGPHLYRSGLSCKQLKRPVNDNTLHPGLKMSDLSRASKSHGLSYLDAIMYKYQDGTGVDRDAEAPGWPCTNVYSDREVTQVTAQVRQVPASVPLGINLNIPS